jgi:hypothetical protein
VCTCHPSYQGGIGRRMEAQDKKCKILSEKHGKLKGLSVWLK